MVAKTAGKKLAAKVNPAETVPPAAAQIPKQPQGAALSRYNLLDDIHARRARQAQILTKLREPFTDNLVSYKPQRLCKAEEYDKLEKATCKICGGYHATSKTGHLSYVGHAAVTQRLLDADLLWDWEPLSYDADGEPHFDETGGLWIKLSIGGMSRRGYGHNEVMKYSEIGSRTKAVIGDAIRNAAMRFGVALEEWHKGDLGLPDPVLIAGLGWGGLDASPAADTKPVIQTPVAADRSAVSGADSPKVEQTAQASKDEPLAEEGEVNFITKKLAALKDTDADKLILDTIGVPTLDGLTKAGFDKLKNAVKGKK
jgi:hypothetical protein